MKCAPECAGALNKKCDYPFPIQYQLLKEACQKKECKNKCLESIKELKSDMRKVVKADQKVLDFLTEKAGPRNSLSKSSSNRPRAQLIGRLPPDVPIERPDPIQPALDENGQCTETEKNKQFRESWCSPWTRDDVEKWEDLGGIFAKLDKVGDLAAPFLKADSSASVSKPTIFFAKELVGTRSKVAKNMLSVIEEMAELEPAKEIKAVVRFLSSASCYMCCAGYKFKYLEPYDCEDDCERSTAAKEKFGFSSSKFADKCAPGSV
jgi:hypothetical protein